MCLTLIVLLCATMNTPAPAIAGGWGVTTLESLPARVVAGQPFEIRFVIRQHGVTLNKDLQPVFEIFNAKTPKRLSNVTAVYSSTLQRYVATITIPTAGEWRWMMTSFPSQRMPTLTVVNASEAKLAKPVPAAVRGRDLFVAKGCFMCHGHAQVPESGQFSDAYGGNGAPNLDHLPYSAAYLDQWLADPKSIKPKTMMPRLELTRAEIQSLVAFLRTAPLAVQPASKVPTRVPAPEVTPPPDSVPRVLTAQPAMQP